MRNLGIHTEMLTDGIIDLYRAGVVTGAREDVHPGQGRVHLRSRDRSGCTTTTDHNPDFSCQPVEMTTSLTRDRRTTASSSINNTTQMDLQGQAASESSGHRHISGTGGQLQFVRGAYASNGGKSFICMSSTYERHGVARESRSCST